MSLLLSKLDGLGLLPSVGRALDLGFGMGKEAIELARRNFVVDAVDKDPNNCTRLEESSKGLSINIVNADLSSFPIVPNSYDLILAINSLPFLLASNVVFIVLGESINGLKKKGVLFISLFGPKDAWAGSKDMNFIDYDVALQYISNAPVDILHRQTEEGFGLTIRGDKKYWHIHKFLCQKK